LALGARGVANAVPALIDMVLEGANDVDAADTLSALARRPEFADQIATGLVDRLAHDPVKASARRRLAQALADIPGSMTSRALADLTHDEDRAVVITANYILEARNASFGTLEKVTVAIGSPSSNMWWILASRCGIGRHLLWS
jgi:HEAT repeat protein